MSRPLRIDDLPSIAVPEQPALAPDASAVVYVLRTIDHRSDRNAFHLWRVGLDGSEAHRISDGPSDTTPAWSPDGTQIAFLRSRSGPAQVWLSDSDGSAARALTDLPLGAGAPRWSPDGTRIAFSAPVDRWAATGEDDAARSARASAPIVVNRLEHFVDGHGWTRGVRRYLHVVEISTGRCEWVADGDWNASDPFWAPDGLSLGFTAAMTPDADLTRRCAAYVVTAGEPGAQPRLVGSATGWAGPGSWSSDGSALVLAGTVGAPNGHYSLLRVAVDGGATVDLAAPLDRNVMYGSPGYPGATPQVAGNRVLFCIRDLGRTHLYAVDERGGSPEPVVTGVGRNVSGLSVAAGRAAVVVTDPTSFGEVVAVDLDTGRETVLTAHGAEVGDRRIHRREERSFAITDGTTVHGWLMRDPGASTPQPLLVDVHGGPHNAWNEAADETHLYHQELVERGWAVFLPNPRGSDGYGEKFYTAAVGGWGIEDARDILEPIDTLIDEGIADPARLALTGYSYGGYMTCFLTSRDSRFAAAIAGGVISDLTSTAGTTDNRRGLSESEFGGRPWGDRARYAAMSPITAVERVRTPTLILHGETDVRCPLGQAHQWHTALRELGVPTELVIYPGASHVFIVNGRPSHRMDYGRRVVDWLERNVTL